VNIPEDPVYEEFKQCKMKCPLSKNETRVIEGSDDDGLPFELDRFLPGEFALNERLPPLKSSVRRKVFKRIVGELLVLDCGIRSTDGILWRRKLDGESQEDLIDINSSTLFKENPDGRILINADGQLIVKQLAFGDSGLYTCSTLSKGLITTFKVFVNSDPKKSHQSHWLGTNSDSICFFLLLADSCFYRYALS